MKLYGIPNCNTVKKARDWLSTHNISVEFHDFKKQGITKADLGAWLTQLPQETLINRSGLTWRGLDDATKNNIHHQAAAIELMQSKTSVIKRPVLVKDGTILCVGFDEARYADIFKSQQV